MPVKMRGYQYYLLRAFKFYDLKNEKLTRTVFIVLLLTSFLSAIAPVKTTDMINFQDVVINIATLAVVYLASTVYLVAFIREQKNKEYTARECFNRVLKKASRIVFASIIFGIIFFIGLFALIIPGILFAVIFSFYICYIVDLGDGISDAFNASKRITKGYRKQIFNIFLFFNLILILPVYILLSFAASSGSSLIITFVLAFTGSVINLMNQRLLALMYMDLEYGISENKKTG